MGSVGRGTAMQIQSLYNAIKQVPAGRQLVVKRNLDVDDRDRAAATNALPRETPVAVSMSSRRQPGPHHALERQQVCSVMAAIGEPIFRASNRNLSNSSGFSPEAV